MNSINLNDQQILKEMKNCVRKAGLPTFDDPCLCDTKHNKFLSKIGAGSSAIQIWGGYIASHRYATLRFASEDDIASENMDAAREIINGMNAHMPFYHYTICPHCNGIELHSGLYVPISRFPRRKFRELLQVLLKSINNVRPVLIEVIRKGGTFDDLKEALDDKYRESQNEATNEMKGERNEEETVS